MNNIGPDFLNPNERWKVDHALDIVKSYAAGYVANSGLHGGINVASLKELFRNSYQAIDAIEEMIKKEEHKRK